MQRGDVFDARLSPTEGSEQAGTRPVVIVSCNAINQYGSVVVVVPLTDAANIKRVYPGHVLVEQPEGGLSLELDGPDWPGARHRQVTLAPTARLCVPGNPRSHRRSAAHYAGPMTTPQTPCPNDHASQPLRRLSLVLLLTVLLFSLLPPPVGYAQGVPPDPGLPGPYPVEQFNFTLNGLGATVFYPGAGGVVAAGGPYAGLVLGHGFARSRAQHANNGIFLASHGYVVVTVDFPSPFSPDFDAWAAQISAALDWLEAQNADPASRFYQQIDVQRLGALGHSAGGMATWVAAGQDSRIKATMPLDPVPANGADLAALGAGLVVPSGWTGAPGSSCNASASYSQLYPLVAAGHKAQYIVANATHCDFEDPTNFLCTLTCGGASDTRRQVWRRYTVAWFKYYLDSDPGYFHYLHGDGLAADLAAGRLTGATARNTEPRNANAQAAISGGAALLSWQPYPAAPLAGYNIYRRRLPDPSGQLAAAPGMTGSYVDAGLPAGQYEYSLHTRDTTGNEHQPAILPLLDVPCYTFDVTPAACDGQVDALDIQALAAAWPSEVGQPGYNSRFDVDGDEMITVVDVQTFAAQWGWPAN